MSRRSVLSSAQRHLRILGALTMAVASLLLNISAASAANLTSASVTLTDPRPSHPSTNYDALMSNITSGTAIGCIKETYATTAQGSTKPASMVTASGITIDGTQTLLSSTTGWTRGGADADGTVTFTNATPATPSGASAKHWILDGFTNSSTADTALFLQFTTYTTSACTTPVDNVTMGFILTNGSTVSLTIDPTLTFTVNGLSSGTAGCANTTSTAASTGSTIPFGTITTASNAIVCQDLAVATNSTNGYTVYVRYTGQLTDANGDVIANTSGTNGSPAAFSAAGTEAYGYSTNDNTLQQAVTSRFATNGTSFAAATTTNAEVAYNGTGVSSQTTRIAHQAGISSTTKPGTYQTTIIYTCTPVY